MNKFNFDYYSHINFEQHTFGFIVYFYYVFVNFFGSFGIMDFQRRDRNLSGFIENIFICVLKMVR